MPRRPTPPAATANATLPAAGVWTITVSFYGDERGDCVATTLKITAPANVATNTRYNAVVALTAASTLTNGPSGLVTLVVTSPSGAVFSTINTTAASAFLGSGYSASIPAATASGTYTLTASYAGDPNYSASSVASAVTIGFFYSQLINTGYMRAQRSSGSILCVLWGAILLAELHCRMRGHRVAQLLCLLFISACAASTLSGCANIPAK